MERRQACFIKVVSICCFILIMFFSAISLGQIAYAEGVGIFFVIEKNPIEKVEILSSAESPEIERGESIMLFTQISPFNANKTIIQTSYDIIRGKKYASINKNKLEVSSVAPIGEQIDVRAIVDDILSDNVLTFKIVETPVQSIEFINEEAEIVVGSSFLLQTKVYPENATNQAVSYSIIEGDDFAQISFNGVLRFKKGVIPDDDSVITILAKSVSNPAVIAEKSFIIKQPSFDTINATLELREVEAMRTYSFNTANEPYKNIFGEKATYYSTDVDAEIATIDLEGLLYIMPTAPIGQIINILIMADGLEYRQELEIVPVYPENFSPIIITEPSIVYDNIAYYLPGDIIEFEIEGFSPINTSDVNKTCALRVADETLASIEGNLVKIADNIEVANPSLSIFVYTINYDEKHPRLESDPFEIRIYVPATGVESVKNTEVINSIKTNQNATELEENREYDLSDLLHFNIAPYNNMACTWKYKICDDSLSYASIIEGSNGNHILEINDNLPQGVISVGVYVDLETYNSFGEYVTISSAPLYFDIYKPTRSVEFDLKTEKPVSAKVYSDTVYFQVMVSETASFNKPSFAFIQGEEFVVDKKIVAEGSEDNITLWSFKLKQDLDHLITDKYKPIKLTATQDGMTSEQFEIHFVIPDEDLELVEASINRGNPYTFDVTHSANSTNKEIEWRVSAESTAKGVSKSTTKTNTFNVPQNLNAGTEIKIDYRSAEKVFFGENAPWKTAVYTIKAIKDTDSALVYSGMKLSNAFNIVYDKDSSGVVIDKKNPQLMTGRNTTITIKYGSSGLVLSDFGIEIKEVLISGLAQNYIISEKITDSAIKVTVGPAANGRTSFSISAMVKDGIEEPFIIQCGSINVFKPISGELSFNKMVANNSCIRDLAKWDNPEDNTATYSISDLKFEVLNPHDGVDYDSKSGIITVNSYKANTSQNIRYYCRDMEYNGITLPEYNHNNSIVLRHITLDKNNGSDGCDHMIILNGFTPQLSATDMPNRFGYYFMGYRIQIGVEYIKILWGTIPVPTYKKIINNNGNVDSDYILENNVNSATADWSVKTTATIVFSSPNNGRDQRITDQDKYTETVCPSLSREGLKSAGYTKLKVTFSFDCQEINDGYQELWVYSHENKQVAHFQVEHGAGHKDTSWWSHTVSCEISLDNVQTDGSFWLRWGANGWGGDDWWLGYTEITVTAEK